MAFLLDLLGTDFFAAAAITVVAGLMRGFAGFGSGMLMAPIFAVLFGPVDTVAMIVALEICVTAQLIPSVREEIEWRFVGPMGAVAALFMPLGSWLLVAADPALLGRAIGAIVVLFVLLLMTGWRTRGPKRIPLALGIGALSGTMMAATSLGNPPVLLYMLSGRDKAATNRANITAYFAVTLAVLFAYMAARGLIAGAALGRVALLLPPYMASAWLGSRLFRASSEALYRWTALVLLLAAGLYGLLH